MTFKSKLFTRIYPVLSIYYNLTTFKIKYAKGAIQISRDNQDIFITCVSHAWEQD